MPEVSSLKIEGRLKDVVYVKNVVAAYRQRLDTIFSRRPEYERASSGSSEIRFTHNLSKSFNRGFTSYFLNGRQRDIGSPDSPKSIGEFLGEVESHNRNCFSLKRAPLIHNGDGLCYLDKNGLNGFRVNRSEGRRIFPAVMPELSIGTKIYRNYDHQFESLLSQKTATRKIGAEIILREISFGFALQISDEEHCSYTCSVPFEKVAATKPQQENIRIQLSKTGETLFAIKNVKIQFSEEWFIPSSLLGEWRKRLVAGLLSARKINYRQRLSPLRPTTEPFPEKSVTIPGQRLQLKEPLLFTYNTGVMFFSPPLNKFSRKTFHSCSPDIASSTRWGWVSSRNKREVRFPPSLLPGNPAEPAETYVSIAENARCWFA